MMNKEDDYTLGKFLYNVADAIAIIGTDVIKKVEDVIDECDD